MNVHSKNVRHPDTVTQGPLPGSRKLYIEPACSPGMRVPVREILLDASAKEPNLRVYDPSGPYTESDFPINLAAGLPPIRESWLAARKGLETYQGRAGQGRGQWQRLLRGAGRALPRQAHPAPGR